LFLSELCHITHHLIHRIVLELVRLSYPLDLTIYEFLTPDGSAPSDNLQELIIQWREVIQIHEEERAVEVVEVEAV
jgi:hypothetical protein